MAMRTALTSLPARLRAPAAPSSAAATGGGLRLLSDGKGRVLSEEERAKETVYIQVQTLNPLPLTISPIQSLRLCLWTDGGIVFGFDDPRWGRGAEDGEGAAGEAQEAARAGEARRRQGQARRRRQGTVASLSV